MPVASPRFTIAHETAVRLRLRFLSPTRLDAARAAIESLQGVFEVRPAPAARSLAVSFDGRSRTRALILKTAAAVPVASRAIPLPPRRERTLPIELPLAAAALTPLLPAPARPAAAVLLIGLRSWSAWRQRRDLTAMVLDSIALASTALTGHSPTAIASLLMVSLAEQRRNALLQQSDSLLAGLTFAPTGPVIAGRGAAAVKVGVDAVEVGDRLRLAAGEDAPVDSIVVAGVAEVLFFPGSGQSARSAKYGTRLPAGTRLLSGTLTVRAERPAVRSRVARLSDHVRHLLLTRDVPGALTPDLERMIAVPLTAAGLVLALTNDPSRTASMLQADPQLGVAMAQPVAREAAAYATARSGLLLSGLEALDRLATASTVILEDVGVIAEPIWHADRIDCHCAEATPSQVLAWLAALAGHGDAALAVSAGFIDEAVSHWREHGTLLRTGSTLLHVAGARQIERVWGITLAEPDRCSLVRRIGIVEGGTLMATVHLGCRLRDNLATRFAQLRTLGVARIAIFTEDTTEHPPAALAALGADAIVSRSRDAQERWLADATERGERVVLVHTGLRALLPPGGLSLCPVDGAAGAHGVLLGDPLSCLVAARGTAQSVRRRLRRHIATAVTFNAALMVAAAARWLPPMATAMAKHGAGLLLLHQSSRLTRVHGDIPTTTEVVAPTRQSAGRRRRLAGLDS